MQAGLASCRKAEPVERADVVFRVSRNRIGVVVTVFVRFQGAILIAALTAVAGSVLEKSILDHRRAIGRQHYRIDALRERVARARLRTERLSALASLSEPLRKGRLEPRPDASPGASNRYEPPLLHWRAVPEGR